MTAIVAKRLGQAPCQHNPPARRRPRDRRRRPRPGSRSTPAPRVPGPRPRRPSARYRQQINSLQGKVDKIGEQYDAASQQFRLAKARLAQVAKQTDRAQQQYNQPRPRSRRSPCLGLRELRADVGHRPAQLGRPGRGALPGVARPRRSRGRTTRKRPSSSPPPRALVTSTSSGSAPRRASRSSAAQYRQQSSMNKLLDQQQGHARQPYRRSSRPQVESQHGRRQHQQQRADVSDHADRVHRADGTPGGQGRRLRLRAARQALCVGRHRARRLRLLRPHPGRLGGGGRDHPQDHLRGLGRPAAHPDVRARSRAT